MADNDNKKPSGNVTNIFTRAPLPDYEMRIRSDADPWSKNALTMCLSRAMPEIVARDATKGLIIIKNPSGDTSVAFPAGMTPLEILLLLTEARHNIEASIVNRIVLPKLEAGKEFNPSVMFAPEDEDLEFEFTMEDEDDDPTSA